MSTNIGISLSKEETTILMDYVKEFNIKSFNGGLMRLPESCETIVKSFTQQIESDKQLLAKESEGNQAPAISDLEISTNPTK